MTNEITPDQAALIATIAPVFLLIFVADRRRILYRQDRFVLIDLLVAFIIGGLAYVTTSCVVYMEDGIHGRSAFMIWTVFLAAPPLFAFITVGNIVRDVVERLRAPRE